MKKNVLFLLIPVAFISLGMSACGEKKAGTYDVSWDLNYESAPSLPATSVDEDATVTKPDDPTRDGYTFINWYTENTCENIYDFSTLVTADITLYAGWNEKVAGSAIYLNPDLWNVDGAWFAAYCWAGESNTWYTLTASGNYFSANIDTTTYSNIVFVRMANTATAPGWNTETVTNVWNQTIDLTFGADNLFTITGWGDESTSKKSIGTWSTYSA